MELNDAVSDSRSDRNILSVSTPRLQADTANAATIEANE